MEEERKTKEQLMSELAEMRQRIAELEAAKAERVRAEEARRESEARYRSLFDRVLVGLYRTTPGGEILDVNPALVQMLGYPDRESLLATNVVDGYVDPEARKRWQALMEREGVVQGFEVQWRRHDGTAIWVKEDARVVRDDEGRVVYYEGGVEDITECKGAEEALRERLKELTCLYAVHRDMQEQLSIDELCRQVMEHLVPAMQFPGITVPVIELDGKRFASQRTTEGLSHGLHAEIRVEGEARGHLWVYYAEARPFVIPHEQNLLNGVTEALGLWLARKRAEEALRHSLEETARSQRLLLALSQAAQAVQRAHTPEEVYQTIGEEVTRLGYNAVIFTLTDDQEHLALRHLTFEPTLVRRVGNLTGLSAQDFRFPLLPGGCFQRIIAEGEPTFRESAPELMAKALPEPLHPLIGRLTAMLGIEQGIVAPLTVGGEAHGLLVVSGTGLTEGDVPAVTAFANQAAIALENARLLEREQEQRKLAQALGEAAATVSSTLDLNEVLDRILKQAEQVVAGEAFSVILIEDDVSRLARWRGYELPGEERQSSRFDIPMTEYHNLTKMAQTGKPVIVPDTTLDPDWVPAARDQGWRRSYVGVPIRLGGEAVGFLSVSGTRPGQFGSEDARRMEVLANHAATAIGNARLYEGIQQKAEELALLLEAATTISSTLELNLVLRTLAEEMTTLIGATFCRIALLDEGNQALTIRAAVAVHHLDWDPGLGRQYALADALWHRQVIERGEILTLRQDEPSKAASETECEVALSEGVQSALLIPLMVGERILGVVSLGEMRSWERTPFTADRVRLCQALANQAAIAIENARLFEEVQAGRERLSQLTQRVVSAQEEERQRLSRELHDELGQALTAISFDLAAMERELSSELAPLTRERLAEARSLTDWTLEQIRELSLDLRPSMLDDLGLVPTLRWYVNRYTKRLNIEVELEAMDLEDRLAAEMETVLYRVVQEALTNVARHAQASRVRLRLERRSSAVRAVIEDDGRGFDVEKSGDRQAPGPGVGLLGIQERVSSLGGSFHIQSRPGQGTRLTIEIPT